MAEENRGHGFLTGLIIGGVLGAALTIWLVARIRPGGRGGAGVGSRAGELASFIKDEVLGGAREVIRRAIEEGREAARSTRADIEERLTKESED